jgi:hypothetical protein
MAGLGLLAAAKKRGFGPANGFIDGLYPRFLLALLFRVISEHAVPVALVCNSCLGYFTAFNKNPWTTAITTLLDALLFIYTVLFGACKHGVVVVSNRLDARRKGVAAAAAAAAAAARVEQEGCAHSSGCAHRLWQ